MQLTDYQRFIHASRYARWLPEEFRRETWKETVDRYTRFFSNRIIYTIGAFGKFGIFINQSTRHSQSSIL